MLGHDWQKASGTIVALKPARATSGSLNLYEFVVDVTMPGREAFRTVVLEPQLAGDFRLPFVGSQVGVEVETKSGKVRFDKSDPRLSVKARKRDEADRFDVALHQPPGDLPQPPADAVAVREQGAELRRTTEEHLEELQRKLREKGLPPMTEND